LKKETIMLPIKSILHPTDFSDYSKFALELSSSIARDYGAKLVILHVKQPAIIPSGVMTPEPVESPETMAELRKKLDALTPADPKVAVEHVMLIGNEAEEIVRLAEDQGYDLIVMGTHGRTGIGRMLMGSVAEMVVRRAPCPVLTVKQPIAAAGPKSKSTQRGKAKPVAAK
jgi:nucleotide-binding universal stress UspA family protein